MSKFLFIEPKAPGLHIYSKFPIPRLGNVVLATMAREQGWDAEVIVEELSGFDIDDLPSADYVGVSSITSTAPRAYEIADAYRSRGVPVIMGGPHVSFMPDEALGHSDVIVQGEGEVPFSSFLAALDSGGSLEGIPNLSFRQGGEVFHNPPGPAVADMGEVPTPDLSLIRSFEKVGRHLIVPIETSRGCPYNCEFCSVWRLFGRRMRYRPIPEVIEEFKRVQDRARMVFIVDDNFTANKERAKELLSLFIDSGIKVHWSAQVRCDAATDDELLELMKRSGCTAVYVGIESINDETLRRIRKGQSVRDVSLAIHRFHRHGIRVHGMFILGFDEDNAKSARRTWRYARRTGLNSVQFLILTPLPGTQFFQRMRSDGRLLTEDWSLYDAHHVVYRPKRMLPFELQRLQIKAHEKFYGMIQRLKHLMRFKFFEYAIARYARRITLRWKKVNRFFMRWLKKISWKGQS